MTEQPDHVHLAAPSAGLCGIVFVPTAHKPQKNKPWALRACLLLNPCDGFHLVYANFDGDGEFDRFSEFASSEPYTDDFYVAWAMLPDELPLIDHFDPRRKDARLRAQSEIRDEGAAGQTKEGAALSDTRGVRVASSNDQQEKS